MRACAAETPVDLPAGTPWPRRPGPVLDWLVAEGRHLPDPGALVKGLGRRLVEAGVPLYRVSFHVRILHPQLMGESVRWRRSAPDEVEESHAPRGIELTDTFLRSPVRVLFEGAGGLRQRLDVAERAYDFPVFEELRAEGATDYVAMPVTFTDGRVHGTTWTSDRPGGFDTEDLIRIADLLPVLGILLEVHATRRIAATLLDTYVGRQAGERVLSGQITRGSGETIRAAIWYCDLAGFTALSERAERDAVIATLNGYFERMAAPVERHGGEILKFIGDAMLAIFPLGRPGVGGRAVAAAGEAHGLMAGLNAERRRRGEEPLGYGIALHAGDVMYGNIGAPDRLDFTVIGPAVNLAVRLEQLTRSLGAAVLLSDDFVRLCDCGDAFPSLGRHRLRGIGRPVEVFVLPEALPAGSAA
ncbi:MAG TPA: adenylate/guanylate cyclase domain-containing protein [Geminicoccaceae bacterium]|nr:adenylate/guanylate cyclase domain-containing protein [Geminicoccaceae bacterium]